MMRLILINDKGKEFALREMRDEREDGEEDGVVGRGFVFAYHIEDGEKIRMGDGIE